MKGDEPIGLVDDIMSTVSPWDFGPAVTTNLDKNEDELCIDYANRRLLEEDYRAQTYDGIRRVYYKHLDTVNQMYAKCDEGISVNRKNLKSKIVTVEECYDGPGATMSMRSCQDFLRPPKSGIH